MIFFLKKWSHIDRNDFGYIEIMKKEKVTEKQGKRKAALEKEVT